MGIRPAAGRVLLINPLIPPAKWDWFCLDRVPYHGKLITVLWDKTGEHFKKGAGFQVFVDGQCVATAAKPGRIRITLPD
jgi:hypothetical protein